MAWSKSSKSGLSTDVTTNNNSLQDALELVNESKSSIAKYKADDELKGKGYASSKAYFDICHGIVLDSISLLLSDGKTANSHVTMTFDGTVVEPLGHEAEKAELTNTLRELRRQNFELRQENIEIRQDIRNMEDDNKPIWQTQSEKWQVLINNSLISSNEETIEKIEKAIQQVDEYSTVGDDKFGDVESFIGHIEASIQQMEGSFNAGTGVFTISSNFASGLAGFLKKTYINDDGTVNEDKIQDILDKGENASFLDLIVLNQFLPEPIPVKDLSIEKFGEELESQVGDANYNSLTMDQRSLYVFHFEYHDDTYKEELDRIFGPASDGSEIAETDDQNMRFFIYTADNDYGEVFRQNLDQIEVATWNEEKTQHYSPTNGKIYINIANNRDLSKGDYTTFFHEVGHQLDDKLKFFGGLRDYKNGEGLTLHDTITNDVRGAIMDEINSHPEGKNLSDAEKQEILDHILDPTYDADPNDEDEKNKGLTRSVIDDSTLEEIRNDVTKGIRVNIGGDRSEAVSDVYGGMSGNELRNGWGHDGDYWYNDGLLFDSRKSPSGEFFAEHFSYHMTNDQLDGFVHAGEGFVPSSEKGMDPNYDSQLEQNNRWLSSSSDLMDEIIANQVN